MGLFKYGLDATLDSYTDRDLSNMNEALHQQNDTWQENMQAEQETLEGRVEELSLACEAMWGLVSTTLEMTDAQLSEAITALESSDKAKDSKEVTKPSICLVTPNQY